MGDGTRENPYIREDVLKLIENNGGKSEGLDLSGTVYEPGIDLSKLPLGGIILKHTSLLNVHFEHAELGDASFEDADLRYAHFDYAELDDASFEYADIRYSHFEKAMLRKASFEDADLRYAHFDYAESNDANFEDADLREANFNSTKLKRANFWNAAAIGANFTGAILEEAYFVEADLKNVRFKDAILKNAYLHGANLLGTNLTKEDLAVVEFSSDTIFDKIDWGDFSIGDNSNVKSAVDVYRRWKVWYNNAGYSDIAAKFYYREKEAYRKSLKLFSKSWNHRIALQLSYWVFGHGEGWKRILFWIAGVVLTFAFIFYIIGTLEPNTFLDCLYYSGVSFIALGYGSWVKSSFGLVKGLGVFETFLGFFIMTLLLVTFVRKWSR